MLPRHALRDRLGRTPLTVVRAPGGSGKTVLLAQWASEHRGAGSWVTVEPDIGGRAAFWTAALDGRLDLDETDRDGTRRDLVRMFQALGDHVLVIDDAHELRDPLVLDDLVALLHACPGLVVLVGTRTRTELEAPRLELTLDRLVVEPEEIALTLAEVESMVGDAGRSGAELLEASGGNPLLLRALLSGSGAGLRPRAAADATIDDYLGQLFDRSGGRLAVFAAVTAVPDDVDVPLAAQLGGVPPEVATELLALLETEGLVMRRDTGGVTRHRYHPVVREVLRARLRRDHRDEYRRANLVASAAAEARRQYLPALRYAVDAEDYARASDVCLHGGFSLLRSRGAAAILERVPFRYVARLPFLAIVLGLAANARGERLRALELLTLALGASRALRGRQRVAERVGLALVESVVLRLTGRADDSAVAARRMAELLADAAPADLEEIAAQEGSYRYQGALGLFRAGQLGEARLAAERVGISAHALVQRRPESLGAAGLVALVDAARGEVAAARVTLDGIDHADFPVELLDGYLGALAHLARAIEGLEHGDVATAAHHVDVLRDRPNLEHGMLVVALGALVELWRGDPDRGLRLLDAREGADRPRARLSTQDRRILATVRTLLHAARGNVGAAHAAARELDRADPMTEVLQAALLLLEQRADLAAERLLGWTAVAGPRVQAAAELLAAAAALRTGERDVAESAMRRFLATSTVHDVMSPVLLVPVEQRPAVLDLAESVGADTPTLDRMRTVPAPWRQVAPRATLTPREVAVLEQLRTTGSFVEIAVALSVSANTVKSQVRTLYRKLEVSTREEALRAASRQGLLGD